MTAPTLAFFTRLLDDAAPGERFALAAEQIRHAEVHGIGRAWVAQHHFRAAEGGLPSPLVFLAHLAARTTRIRLGTGVITLPLEDPVRVAEDAVVADLLADGRLDLGLGSGGTPSSFVPFGEDVRDKAQTYDRKLGVLLDALSGRDIGADNTLYPDAGDLRDRIWQATFSAAGGRRAGIHGHGLLLSRTQPRSTDAPHAPLAALQEPIIDAYLDALPSGAAPRITASRTVFVADDRADALRFAEVGLRRAAEGFRRQGQTIQGDDLDDLIAALDWASSGESPRDYRDGAYFEEIQRRKGAWFQQMEAKSGSAAVPMTMARAVREIQRALRDDAIVVTGAGLPQGMVKQRWVTRYPRTHVTSGGFSTMGFELPAAIGCQLAAPDQQVVAIGGDGSFLQTMQELAAAAMLGVPVCMVVLDNSGWISIKGGQEAFMGRTAVTDFLLPDGDVYRPDYAGVARSFGIHAAYVDRPEEVCDAVARALATQGPSLVHVRVDRDLATAGPDKTGWWDAPVPEYHPDQRAAYLAGLAEEQQF